MRRYGHWLRNDLVNGKVSDGVALFLRFLEENLPILIEEPCGCGKAEDFWEALVGDHAPEAVLRGFVESFNEYRAVCVAYERKRFPWDEWERRTDILQTHESKDGCLVFEATVSSDGIGLSFECPFCKEVHCHGNSGGALVHRVAHCFDPPQGCFAPKSYYLRVKEIDDV